jgi:cobalamin biosynthesis Mg chelatase CobN
MRSLGGWRSGTPLLLVMLATGVAVGLFASSAARADDPPPTTVSTPTLPTPVPAPAQPPARTRPAHKSAPRARSTPTRGTTTSRPKSGAAVPTSPTVAHARPTVVSPPTRVVPKQAGARAKKAERKAKAALGRKRKAPPPKVKAHQTLGAAVGFQMQPNAKSGNTHDTSSLFVILGCALAVACFCVALFPAAVVPWRPVAIFISHRQLDLTLAGLALLAAAMWVYGMKGL